MNYCDSHSRCIKTALSNAEKICAKNKLKFTGIRRRVLELVWESHKPAKAYDILQQLGEGDGSPVPPTVYRALDFLLDNGLVHKINSLNAYVGCSHPGPNNQCYFLICTNCEQVSECCTSKLGKAIDVSVKENAFIPESVSLEIQGVCQTCSA